MKLDLNASENGTLTEIYYYSGETDNARLQREYNDIINSLNNSSGIFFSNYEISSGYEDLDMLISSINASQNYVTIQYASPFYIGTLTHYKSIVSEVEWDYFPMGDPSLLKHVSEGTLMVEQNSLDKLTLGYASDLSGDFENVTFTLDGDGSYGKALFGETAFGGNGTSYPLRTLIPRQKQRCRYIKTRMYHDSAWSKFGVVGISYRFEITSERAYRR